MAGRVVSALLLVTMVAGCSGSRGVGVGFVVGEPTGVALKGWLDHSSSVNFAAGWPDEATQLQLDYAFHNFSAVHVTQGDFALYMGIGGAIKLWDEAVREDEVAVRIPLGIDYIFEGGQLDLFVEVVPLVKVAPDSDFDVTAAFGARFFFK